MPREAAESARRLAENIQTEEKISTLDCRTAQKLTATEADNGVCYVIDVRSEREFATAHVPGSINVPGGQAVQRADDFVPVRNGKIIFVSEDGCRAVMAAYWYGQMGFKDVHVLAGGLNAWRSAGMEISSGKDVNEPLGFGAVQRGGKSITVAEVAKALEQSAMTVLDVSSSAEYEAGHVPGARWLTRGWLDIKCSEFLPDKKALITLTCSYGDQSVFAARDLSAAGYENVSVLEGGVRAWFAAGQPKETGLTLCLTEANDIVLSPSIKGTKEDMQRYLNWELTLTRSK